MNRAGLSYSKIGIALGITRDGLYKKANPTLTNNNLSLAEAAMMAIKTGDITVLQEFADLIDLELVPRGTMAAIKALPDAMPAVTQEARYPLYQRQPRRPLLRAMMEEASEKAQD